MKNINIYYTIDKPKEDSNYRIYYISKFIGMPFKTYSLPSDFEKEKIEVANHLGLTMNMIKFHSHRGNK